MSPQRSSRSGLLEKGWTLANEGYPLGIPPAATPPGYMMLLIDCGAGFKDWYFAESGSEGPRKLQGYKALNREQAQLRAGEMVRELKAFLSWPASLPESELERAARQRAREIINMYQPQTGD